MTEKNEAGLVGVNKRVPRRVNEAVERVGLEAEQFYLWNEMHSLRLGQNEFIQGVIQLKLGLGGNKTLKFSCCNKKSVEFQEFRVGATLELKTDYPHSMLRLLVNCFEGLLPKNRQK